MIGTSNASDLISNASDFPSNASDFPSNASDFPSNASDLSEELKQAIDALTPKARKNRLWPLILKLCLQRAVSAEEIATLLNREMTAIKVDHLTPMRKECLLDYLYPEVVNHPHQAYKTTQKGQRWLENHNKV
jgi:ATP-dependent DNA helicase RecG